MLFNTTPNIYGTTMIEYGHIIHVIPVRPRPIIIIMIHRWDDG